jgi:hypothetical protein
MRPVCNLPSQNQIDLANRVSNLSRIHITDD